MANGTRGRGSKRACHDLGVPKGVRLVFKPAYTPEVQPAETPWTRVDEPVVNQHMPDIEALDQIIQRAAALLVAKSQKSNAKQASTGAQNCQSEVISPKSYKGSPRRPCLRSLIIVEWTVAIAFKGQRRHFRCRTLPLIALCRRASNPGANNTSPATSAPTEPSDAMAAKAAPTCYRLSFLHTARRSTAFFRSMRDEVERRSRSGRNWPPERNRNIFLTAHAGSDRASIISSERSAEDLRLRLHQPDCFESEA